ncbi:hypothetical protein ZIOFF_037299 [Zingiber officinale]|uniref:Uncharacterized protein n=1 Tax=Zingiber officinale TaxID=94328 RepID=A0A8J5GD28_ZINOF|nr:hypothetical protein ZIOFF_037299 [Zingiber officinale]
MKSRDSSPSGADLRNAGPGTGSKRGWMGGRRVREEEAAGLGCGGKKLRRGEILGTIDFVLKGTKEVVFRTCCAERNRVVFQMGIAVVIRALSAAQIVCKDVAALLLFNDMVVFCSIDVDTFFIMQILTTLRRNLDTTITCKICLLDSFQETAELARRIEKTSISALAVHGRY